MKTRFAALLAFALTACANIDESGNEQIRAMSDALGSIGSRLRPYELVANDGTVTIVPGVWYDLQLQTTCTFESDNGGPTSRCLPPSIAVPRGYYSDAACTLPVAIFEHCPNPPRFIRDIDPAACVQLVGLRPLGRRLFSQDNWYLNGTACIQQQPIPNGFAAYPILPVMSWSDFVSALQYPLP